MQVPREYQGREQSYLKHRVLQEYLLGWGHKLGSAAQRRRVRLCYVDGFAGPWQAQSAALEDTSIAIGLRALETAVETWRTQGHSIDVDAYFFDHINRFKDDPRQFLRDQMREFFGLGERDMPEALDEDELFALYRHQLKEQCRVTYAADLAIPHPIIERTKFRLVVGGKHSKVLELFRKIEKDVIGGEAAAVREQASRRATEEKTGQQSLFALLPPQPAMDSHYGSLHDRALAQAPRDLLARLAKVESIEFQKVWPELLEAHHLTKTELGQHIWKMYRQGEIRILNLQPQERSVKDEHVLAAALP